MIIASYFMNGNNVLVECPKHLVMLDMSSVGAGGSSKISKATKVDKAEVETIINDHATKNVLSLNKRRAFLTKRPGQAQLVLERSCHYR